MRRKHLISKKLMTAEEIYRRKSDKRSDYGDKGKGEYS